MSQVMDTGTTPMPTTLLRGTQPDGLADDGEVVSGAAGGEALAMIGDEERVWHRPEKPLPFSGIGGQSDRRAVGEREQPGLPEFPASE